MVGIGGVEPTSAELSDISLAIARVLDLDDNAARPGDEFTLDLQGAVRGFDPSAPAADAAPRRLFATVAPTLWDRPTFKAFYALLDNYAAVTGRAEARTAATAAEEAAFLDACLGTRPLAYMHALLAAKGLAPADVPGFRDLLHGLWFAPYSRDAHNDSSGFEHVFVGEVRGGDGPGAGKEVLGLHNWIAIMAEEGAGRLNYYGYLKPRAAGAPKGAPRAAVTPVDRVLTIQASWRGAVKAVTSTLVGTSPECELALFTLCVLAGAEETEVRLWGEYDVRVRAYQIRTKAGVRVGSAFVECLAKGAGGSSLGGGRRPGGGYGGRPGGGGGRPRPQRPQQQQPGCGNIVFMLLRELVKLLR